eukprot:956482-Rhodomonas_salina.1
MLVPNPPEHQEGESERERERERVGVSAGGAAWGKRGGQAHADTQSTQPCRRSQPKRGRGTA